LKPGDGTRPPAELAESDVDWNLALQAYEETAPPNSKRVKVHRFGPFIEQEQWYREVAPMYAEIFKFCIERLARTPVSEIEDSAEKRFGYRLPCDTIEGKTFGYLQFWVSDGAYHVFYFQRVYRYNEILHDSALPLAA
jgi:hypothetical protein